MAHQQQLSFARPSQPFLVLNSPMDAPPRPLEPILNSVGISLAASSGPSLTDLSDLQPKSQPNRSSNAAHDALMRNPRQQLDPLSNWFTNPQQGPWDPLRSNASVVRPGGRGFQVQPGSASFAGYRSQALPSESDATAPGHILSDSGYGSWTRQSIADASVYGDCDRSGDAASISSHIAGIHFDRPMISPPEVWSHQASATNDASVTLDVNKRLVCPYCNARVKTKSELKKHGQKHTKPYHCDVPGCIRTEGFSTPNDVDRHRRSCHPDTGTRGKYFKCTIPGCRRKDKKWPRADNFRQHLKRIHRIEHVEDDIEKYVCEPETASSGADLAGLASVGHGLIPLNVNHHGINSSPWSFPMQSVQQGSPASSYMDQQMAFSQHAVPHPHDFMARSGGRVPSNLMQMSPMGLESGAVMSRTEANHSQARLQGLIASSDVTQEVEFEESSYFNEASISDDESERDDDSVVHQVSGPEAESPGNRSEKFRSLEQPASRDCEEDAAADEEEDAPSPLHVIPQDKDDASSTTSSSSVSGPSEAVALTQSSHGAPKLPQPLDSGAPLDFADVIKDQGKVFDFFKALKERGMLEMLLEKIDYQAPNDKGTSMPSTATVPGRDASKTLFVCLRGDCNKSFPRQCELRKHEKRHAKPYGCTFPKCDKRFGSKNDWKRHENSQHYQLELWKCTEKGNFAGNGAPPASCARVFNRREQFRSHLQHDHGIADTAYVEQRLEDCLDGRNYEVRFWCGFCSRMVQVEERGLKAWLGRFNHIDSHFAGQRDISEWKNPDPGLQEVDVVVMSPGAQASFQARATVSAQVEECGGGGRASKRGAEGALRQRGPSKKARQSVLWYCCRCDTQQLAELSTACMTPSCRGHEPCDDCHMEILPSGSDEQIV